MQFTLLACLFGCVVWSSLEDSVTSKLPTNHKVFQVNNMWRVTQKLYCVPKVIMINNSNTVIIIILTITIMP